MDASRGWLALVIADALVEAGISPDEIVLAFKPPDIRPDTGFAVS